MAKSGCLYPGSAPYPGHVQFRSDSSKSEHGTGTSAGRSGVTEGGKIPTPSGRSHGKRGYPKASVKHK